VREHSAVPRRKVEIVRPFDYEPSLLEHLSRRDAEAARRSVVAEAVWIDRGELYPPAVHADDVELGFLVLEGLLLHRIEHVGRRAVELLGPGDLIRPWRPSDLSASLPSSTSWLISESTRLALLDRRFQEEIACWPGVLPAVLDRLNTRIVSMALQLSLAKLPRLETRLQCLFWHLADRWGRVERERVVISLRISHQILADLVSARRTSVTHALGELRDSGALVRLSPDRWLLRGRPPAPPPRAVEDPALGIR
jgi:CRP/FNR family transcriptional regulator, cyclic AMP receptor protein